MYIPRPENDKERHLAQSVEDIAAEFDTEVIYYNESGKITIGEITLSQKHRIPYGDGTATTIIEIASPDGVIAYIGSGTLNADAKEIANELIDTAHTLILSKCGKKYKPEYIFDMRQDNLESIILAGEELFFTQVAREFYDDRGAEFYLRPKKLELMP